MDSRLTSSAVEKHLAGMTAKIFVFSVFSVVQSLVSFFSFIAFLRGFSFVFFVFFVVQSFDLLTTGRIQNLFIFLRPAVFKTAASPQTATYPRARACGRVLRGSIF